MEPDTQKNISSRIIKTELINWKNLKFIQQDNFKDLSDEAKKKLMSSIVNNDFTQPFYVWEDPDKTLWCLDGKHRSQMLSELESTNMIKPPKKLPATFIQCENKQEASKLVLLYSSQYAKVTEQGFIDFIKLNDLDIESLNLQIDIPKFDLIDNYGRKENSAVEFEDTKQFFLNIKCESEQHAQELYETFLSQGLEVKIVT